MDGIVCLASPAMAGSGPAATCLKQRAGIFDGVALKW
jgi:hypothetical protein